MQFRKMQLLLAVLMAACADRPTDAGMITINTVVEGRVRDVFGVSFGPLIDSHIEAFTNGSFVTRGILEFDISSLPSISAITSVKLRIANYTGNGSAIDVYGFSGDGTLTLADAAISGTAIASFTTVGLNEITLPTAFLDSLAGSGNQYARLVLDQTIIPMGALFIESGSALGQDPVLSVEFNETSVPEPTAIILFGCGAIAVFGRSYSTRRRSLR